MSTPEGGSRPQEGRAAQRAAMFGGLLSASHMTTFEELPGLVAGEAHRAGLSGVEIFLADLQQEVLSPLSARPRGAGEAAEGEIRIEGTLAGRAYQHGRILPATAYGRRRWWVPLVDGTERLGVLAMTTPYEDVDPAMLLDMERLAGLVALLVLSKRSLSDSYDRLVRRRRISVAAEMEWRLMPPRTFATGQLVISAVMEPAYEVSGDVFDYAFDGRTAQLAIFDAMGHDTAAGLTANLALSTTRKARTEAGGLARVADAVEGTLLNQFGGDRFATGILATLDVPSGGFAWLTRGHLPPLIIRRRSVVELDCPPGAPMGTGLDAPGQVCHTRLQPGDRLLLYTDGITEARNRDGEVFGVERFTDFMIRHQADELPLPETLRRLIRRHLEYHQGRLSDDATVLLVEWPGPAPYPSGEAEDLVGLPPEP